MQSFLQSISSDSHRSQLINHYSPFITHLSVLFILLLFFAPALAQTKAPMNDGHYLADIKFFGKRNTGILTVKHTDSLTRRMIMTTQTGFKIFDFAVRADSMTLIEAIGSLKKESVLKIIKADLRYLVSITPTDKFEIKLQNKTTYITFHPSPRTKVLYKLTGNTAIQTDEIHIKHNGLPIKYKFVPLPENND